MHPIAYCFPKEQPDWIPPLAFSSTQITEVATDVLLEPIPATPASTHIPAEIVDACMAYLSTEKQTLRSCSLVCRAWVYPTRRYLYHSWTISAFAWDRFYKSILLLANPLCTFASSIRHLAIIDKYASQSMYSSFDWNGVLGLVLPHVHRLTSLRALDLSNFYRITTSETWNSLLAIPEFSQQILELNLHNDNPTYYSFDLITKVICSFPSLVTLKYQLACSGPGDTESVALCRPSPSLRHLVVDFSLSRKFIPTAVAGSACMLWERLLRDHVELESMTLSSPYLADLSSVDVYSGRLGKNLARLDIEFHADTEGAADAGQTFFSRIHLINNPGLHSLSIKGVLSWEIPKGIMSPPQDLHAALTSLAGVSVQEICLRIPTTFGKRKAPPAKPGPSSEVVWGTIDELLVSGTLPELRKVHFLAWKETELFLREKLGASVREGLIEFTECNTL
ncbi:hypothetical protein BDQ17DRAFT_1359840 [Cyathus striatus]|nr:hypothetical protein BDQ17DRAFT_1359840 [Cyathus striatus]